MSSVFHGQKVPSGRNTLHYSDFPNSTIQTFVGCIVLGSSTPGCYYVTYSYSSLTCYLHKQLQGRQPVIDTSRVWSKNVQCKSGFVYFEEIGACLYFSDTTKLSWTEAKNDCEDRHGRLIVANTMQIVDALADLFKDNLFWIGGYHDIHQLGSVWMWIDGGRLNVTQHLATPGDDTSMDAPAGLQWCLAMEYEYFLNKTILKTKDCSLAICYLCEMI
ncbi:uncharacterized protein LOC117340659 [Pecten maximus]|uniref:uncharacterized protein LOC117340659 n=1 Tax=Pecten maximus TaxID=6579 RepID=UPI001459122E|nr:uncharacterized protein LOC117340659 [Pecten maximus]